MTNGFIVLQTTLWCGGKCVLCYNVFFFLYYNDEGFSTGDDGIESTRLNFCATQLRM